MAKEKVIGEDAAAELYREIDNIKSDLRQVRDKRSGYRVRMDQLTEEEKDLEDRKTELEAEVRKLFGLPETQEGKG